jgi:low molecular weight protein-tyrosine phosphatase
MAERWKSVKRIVPENVVRFLRDFRDLPPRFRLIYLRLRIRGLVNRSRRFNPGGVQSVIFVCKGNVIRSPMAAALLRKHLQKAGHEILSISSAGLHADAEGRADLRALRVSREFGVSLEEHRIHPLSQEVIDEADAVFVMDHRNEAEFLGRYRGAEGKVYRLAQFAQGTKPDLKEIQDPFNGSDADIRGCYEILEICTSNLASVLAGAK